MKMPRTFPLAALAVLIASSSPASEPQFAARLAAWQSGAPAPAAAAVQAEASRPAAPSPSVLAQTYAAPVHAPNYHRPAPLCYSWGDCGPGPATQRYEACGPDGCGPGGCDACGYGDCGCNTILWAKFDLLLWWRQGRDYPPLVTTDPVVEPSTTAGILPDAEILFGGGRVGTDMQAGGRFDVGWWTDPRQCCGFGWRFFGLGKDASEFNITSLQRPVLAIPFFDVDADQNDALLVAYPGLRSGEIHVAGTSEVLGNDIYGRFLLCRGCNSRLDFITGWHFSRINDGVEIRSQSTVTEVGGNIPLGTVTTIRDQFDARNEFHGGILGLMWERDCGCWTTNVLARMAIGNMHETMIINGSTRFAVPGETPVETSGGLFTGDSNIGLVSRNEFTAVTEVGFTLGYRWGPCTRINVGYTFIYWNDVISASGAINPNIDPEEGTQPTFTFRHSDYWVQGINLGIVREF
jgi:hypothetical protein